MRVFVTGATGFVGSNLVRLLVQEGCEVTALARPGADLRRIHDVRERINLVEGDLLLPESFHKKLQASAPELSFHLAWFIRPGVHPDSVKNVELVTASMELLQILDAVGCPRTVITGTFLEQDTAFGHLAEQTPIKPQNFYAACKHALHVMAEHFQARQGRGLVWARLFNIYGAGEYAGPLVPDVILKLLANQSCALTEGTQQRDYLHVEDVAAALWAIGRSTLQGAVNIGSSQPVSVFTVANTIGTLMGRSHLLLFGARLPTPFDCKFCVANSQRLRAETGWSPRVQLEDGLAQTIQWWKSKVAG